MANLGHWLFWIFGITVLTSLQEIGAGTFNPICYVNRTFASLNSSGTSGQEPRGPVITEPSLSSHQTVLRVELVAKPRDNCSLDIYVYGGFWVVELIVELVELRCITSSEGYTKAEAFAVKTGRQEPDDRFPGVPGDWWDRIGIVAVMKIAQVNANNVGEYTCFAKHKLLDDSAAINLTIAITVIDCPPDTWGENCDQICQCQNGGTCHSWDGTCLCNKLWKGDTCAQEYPHVEINTDVNKYFFGDSLYLTCQSYRINVSEGNYTWLRDDEIVFSRSSVLGVTNLTDKESGTYTCRAIDETGKLYTNTIEIYIEGCRPGVYGFHCNISCECLDVHTHCDRFEGCMCPENQTGLWCNDTITACTNGTESETCKGCRPGVYGFHCNISCECLDVHTHCDRFEGCMCPENQTGLWCNDTITACTNETESETCKVNQEPGPSWSVVGWAVGGTICVVAAIAIIIALLIARKRVSLESHSRTNDDYFRSKNISELVKNRSQLRTSDLGILWTHWGLEESGLYIGQQIAEGCFSTVYEGHIINDTKVYGVAIKVLKDEKDEVAWKNFMGEFEILAQVCKHPHIVQMVGLCTKQVFNKVVSCLVLEHMTAGSLYTILHQNRNPKTAAYLLQRHHYSEIVLGIVKGMSYLEKLKYVHRDLAARNVLLNESLVAKISDFGLARDIYSTGDYHQGAGRKALPWKWMAYESIKDNVFSSKSDIWSFGVLLWEISTLGASPYPGVSNEGLLAHLDKGNRLEKPPACSEVWYAAMKICWDVDAEARPRFEELVPFFQDLFKKRKNKSPFHGEASIYQEEGTETGVSTQTNDPTSPGDHTSCQPDVVPDRRSIIIGTGTENHDTHI